MNGLIELGYGCKVGFKIGKLFFIDCGIFFWCGGERYWGYWNVGLVIIKIWFVIFYFFVII